MFIKYSEVDKKIVEVQEETEVEESTYVKDHFDLDREFFDNLECSLMLSCFFLKSK